MTYKLYVMFVKISTKIDFNQSFPTLISLTLVLYKAFVVWIFCGTIVIILWCVTQHLPVKRRFHFNSQQQILTCVDILISLIITANDTLH